jgi:DNA polymerase-3 subunit gamma/tau
LLDDAERERLTSYARVLDAEYLQLAYQIAIHGRDELALAPDDYSGFVMALLRLHAFRPERGGAVTAPAKAVPAAAAGSPAIAPNAAASAPALPAVSPAPTFAKVALSAAPAVAEPAPAVQSAAPVVDDWHALVARLPLTGMVKQLAQHCELSERSESAIRLRLDPAHKYLLGKPQQDKLQAELQASFGALLRLEIDVAEVASETPAERSRNTERERQDRAIVSIEQDPFVRDVVDLFDASIDESTIKPV